MTRKKIMLVMGARPNFMKVAPLIWHWRSNPSLVSSFELITVHTGQHYDEIMSSSFLRLLDIPNIDYALNAASGSQATQTGSIMVEFEKVCSTVKPDCVVVVGDINSTMACAIVAKKMKCLLIHIEAGLRSFNRIMPEEINRLVTDSITDLYLTTSDDASEQLMQEGVPEERIAMIGNLMIDSLLVQYEKTPETKHYHRGDFSSDSKGFALLTLHRPENVDDPAILKTLLDAVREVSRSIPVYFPCHPRTIQRISEFKLEKWIDGKTFIKAPPADYDEMMRLYRSTKFVMTDSGGIQEETTALGIPCLTLRSETERPITVSHGTNVIVGSNVKLLLDSVQKVLHGQIQAKILPPLWDGQSSERVWREINKVLGSGQTKSIRFEKIA